MPVSPCRYPGCYRLVQGRHCTEHATAHSQARGSASSRGYGAAWRKVRARVLTGEPWCRDSLLEGIAEPATEPHHLMRRRQGGSDDPGRLVWGKVGRWWIQRWVGGNLVPLSHRRHSARTGRGE